jgi:hypothetical protein
LPIEVLESGIASPVVVGRVRSPRPHAGAGGVRSQGIGDRMSTNIGRNTATSPVWCFGSNPLFHGEGGKVRIRRVSVIARRHLRSQNAPFLPLQSIFFSGS